MPPTPTTIPTSFVPKQPVRPGSSYAKSGSSTFLFVSFIILGVVLLGVVGVFAYEKYLISTRDSKAEQVTLAQQSINEQTVEDFIRTRNRFIAANTILDEHVAVSGFFTLLESLTLTTVRFNSLSFTLTDDRSAEIRMDGTARTFNALAAQSSAFASEKKIQRAIFSNISVGEGNTVTFSLSADIDPELITFVAPESVPMLETQPSTLDDALINENSGSPEELTVPLEDPAPGATPTNIPSL